MIYINSSLFRYVNNMVKLIIEFIYGV